MADVAAVVDRTVRAERGRIVGGLLRFCGTLDLAEEAFQEATLSALEAWGAEVPSNPGAWLMTAAKNVARNAWRKRAVAEKKAPLLVDDDVDEMTDTITDDFLRLVFTCCHPALTLESQIALTLKIVAGFSTEEIARAFVTTEETISQRILRAKQSLAGLEYSDSQEPSGALGVVYAMFNEGHIASSGPLLRLDLQAEALRLARIVCDSLPREPEAFGLLAIILFGAARAGTRVDDEGLPVLLEAQERARWNRPLIREALIALRRARSLGGQGPYVVQARIAAVHIVAPRYEDTDWDAILALYSLLPSTPIVELNRAVAIGVRDGAKAGHAALTRIAGLEKSHLFYAVRADFERRLGRDPRSDLERALALVTNDGERRLLERRLAR
jgi:RNA polymerase sigma-70 factor (ECF subfamily)